MPAWLILLSLKAGRPETQRELAAAVGIQGATLTHHLDAMERTVWSRGAAIRRTAGPAGSSNRSRRRRLQIRMRKARAGVEAKLRKGSVRRQAEQSASCLQGWAEKRGSADDGR